MESTDQEGRRLRVGEVVVVIRTRPLVSYQWDRSIG
jgi:hypothetical protein